MDVNISRNDAPADQVTTLQSNNPFPSISQLPTELLVDIFQLSLPEINVKSPFTPPSDLRCYLKRLYIMRSVAKRWRAVIEGTPSFWTTIAFKLPSHVSEASILRSSNLPLHIVCYNPQPAHPNDGPSATEFLELIQHTRPRWSTLTLELYDPIAMPSYLGAPLPLLQTIIVKSVCYTSSEYQPLELLGGDTSNLRSVKLSRVAIRWPTGNFVQLKYLKLKDVTYDSLTAQPLLDALRASPGLQVLKLIRMRGKEIPQPSPTITLHHLKHITLYNCALSLVECILGGIQAPSCTGLTLSILDQRSLDVPHFLDVTLKPFHPILRKLHRLHGGSEVILDFRGFEWHTGNHWDEEGLSMYMESFNDPTLTEWIDRTLKGESGLMIVFGHGGTFSEAVLRSVAPMRCVTKVAIGKSWDIGSVGSVLQFLSKPLTTSASLPSLPCLQELYLPPKGWNTRDLLEMVQARFCTLGWEATERTPLTIDVVKWGLWGRGGPGLPLDLATLVNIRKTSGVNLGGRKHPEGTLALVWNDEASEAVWF